MISHPFPQMFDKNPSPILPNTRCPIVTAGLMCPPEAAALAKIPSATPRPPARAPWIELFGPKYFPTWFAAIPVSARIKEPKMIFDQGY